MYLKTSPKLAPAALQTTLQSTYPAELLASFAPRLIAWQREHGRHDLPWQNTRDPYRIWLSEIMLQQTQVSTVIPYYARFLDRFPTVEALAAAPADDVMALWAGLGYYTRARNLHRCAQVVAESHGGKFPSTVEGLAELPGIGRSTAAAIASFAFGARATILDGNVKRVLARVFGVEGFPGEKRVENAMWTLAESLVPGADATDADVSAYTQGLMDLGATLCTRGKPDCERCPFASDCVAKTTNRQRQLPASRPKKAVPTRQTWMLILLDGDAVMLEKRPPSGIWGGLWSLPEAADEAALAARADGYGAQGAKASALASLQHTFTHFKLDIEPRVVELDTRKGGALVAQDGETAWVALREIDAYGVPAPVRKLLDGLRGSLI